MTGASAMETAVAAVSGVVEVGAAAGQGDGSQVVHGPDPGGQTAPMDFAGAVRAGGQSREERFHPLRTGEPRLRRPNTVILHTNRVAAVPFEDVVDAVLQVVGVDAVKSDSNYAAWSD